MNEIGDIANLALKTLMRLYDQKEGGFYFSVNEKGTINKNKLLRYNARIVVLLDRNQFGDVLVTTADYIINNLVLNPNNQVLCSVQEHTLASAGDVSLLITALNKIGGYEENVNILTDWIKSLPVEEYFSLNADQIPWLLSILKEEKLEHYLMNVRRMRNKQWFFNYVSFPAIIYAINYFTGIDKIDVAIGLFNRLKKRFLTKRGEWVLSRLLFINPLTPIFCYKKAFSVHQLGMAPLYLLNLYDKSGDDSILSVVEKSIDFGKRLVGKESIYRSFSLKETRSYECAFDYAGLMKWEKYR